MSTLWTPGGERPVAPPPPPPAPGPSPRPAPAPPGGAADEPALTPEQMEAEMAELRDQLAATPAAVIVANHAFGLFELAALHLSVQPPNLAEASLAIDALGTLVEGLPGRLGEAEGQLKEALTQLRLAFVQVRTAAAAPPPPA